MKSRIPLKFFTGGISLIFTAPGYKQTIIYLKGEADQYQ